MAAGTWQSQNGIFALWFLAFFCLISVYVTYIDEDILERISWISDNFTFAEDNTDNIACKVPKLDPWDPSIKKYIQHPGPVQCRQVQPFLTYVDKNGYLKLNDTESNLMSAKNLTFICTYRTFDRRLADADDYVYDFDETKQLKQPVKLNKDMVDVSCKYNGTGAAQFYRNLHAHPVDDDYLLFAKPTEQQLSLLIVLVDSTSHSALERNLPLTYNYTKNVMGMKFFTAFNKVGMNSFPNQIAYLTGKRAFNEQEDMPSELPTENSQKRMDTWPLIYKLFATKGYETTHIEDWPHASIYIHPVKGFRKKPFDHFYYPFWLMWNKARNKRSSTYCHSNDPVPKIVLDLTKRHVLTRRDRLQFIWSSMSESAHQSDNEVQQIDGFLRDFWKELYVKDLLNKTAVLFVSDHGIRFGEVRMTVVGWQEEQRPFVSIWFPEWFYKLHPNIKSNVEYNANLFAASYDVYETMKDIFDANYDGVQRNFNSKGQSLLYKLPLNRNCRSAGVPEVYCTCINGITLDVRSSLAMNISQFILGRLNFYLSNFTALCQPVTLSKIIFLRQLSDKDSDFRRNVKMAVETNPFAATFEAVVKVDNKTDSQYTLIGDIVRTSKYKGLSDCVNDVILKRYCACYNVTKV